MKLDVSGVISGKEKIEDYRVEFDLPAGYLDEFGISDVSRILADADVTARSERQLEVEIDYKIGYVSSCARCLKSSTKSGSFSIDKVIFLDREDEEYEDDREYLADRHLLIEKMILDDIIFKIPSRILCDEDCKGLCPSCGQNLNESSCRCKKDETDPRFEALRGYFK